MTAVFTIAIRNLFKNRRRSANAVLAIALGFAAVNVFGGFTRYINASLRDSFIYSQGNGHLTVFREGFLESALRDPAGYLLDQDLADSVTALIETRPEVILVTPQLYVSGMLSNGTASTIFFASGRIPSDLFAIMGGAKGMLGRLVCHFGEPLRDEVDYGIAVSTGLAAILNLDLGSRVIALSSTVDGQVNALDAEVFQTFESPVELLNDKFLIVPLEFARSLYDTRGADRLTVVLAKTEQTAAVRARLERDFAERGLPLEIKSWEEMSLMYRKVRTMFDIIFAFLFVIVLVISLMSVINTINMAVMERIREIGTLRALGMRRTRIVSLFAVESGVLGVAGSVVGVGFTLLAWGVVKILGPTWVPPMITNRIPLEIHLVPEYLLTSFVFLLALSVGAACFPARRAAREGIVDALGHV